MDCIKLWNNGLLIFACAVLQNGGSPIVLLTVTTQNLSCTKRIWIRCMLLVSWQSISGIDCLLVVWIVTVESRFGTHILASGFLLCYLPMFMSFAFSNLILIFSPTPPPFTCHLSSEFILTYFSSANVNSRHFPWCAVGLLFLYHLFGATLLFSNLSVPLSEIPVILYCTLSCTAYVVVWYALRWFK